MFAKLSFGQCEFNLSPGGNPGPRDVSLWFDTDRIQDLYESFKARRFSFNGTVSMSRSTEGVSSAFATSTACR